MIQNAGIEPEVIEYLKNPPTRDQLFDLIERSGLSVREVVREKGTPFAELGLGEHGVTDDQLLDAMMEHPILINRPIVVTELGVRLCRPSEVVLDILPTPQKAPSPRKTAKSSSTVKATASPRDNQKYRARYCCGAPAIHVRTIFRSASLMPGFGGMAMAPHAGTTLLDLLYQLGHRARIPFVFLGNLAIRWPHNLVVGGVTRSTCSYSRWT